MKRFYSAYRELGQFVEQAVPQTQNEIMEQLVPQLPEPDIKHLVSSIPWGHNVLILKKIKAPDEALFYIRETISNNWSRSVLQMQIESNLYLRQGKAVNNFKLTLPEPQSDLAVQMLKDPYNFNFLTLEKNVRELEVESQLTTNITRLLLEMGKGFAYLGRQYPILVSGREYRLDLLFYQVKLKCYILIELKTGDFEPEFIGKLNFYLSALDTQVKAPDEAPSIGILLCKNKENLIVEYSLRDIKKPIGVSTFTFNELPADIKSFMPSIEDFENEMNRTNDAF
jgi:predicted nuclease of restriction endonuclease-like (RecB) superfamily